MFPFGRECLQERSQHSQTVVRSSKDPHPRDLRNGQGMFPFGRERFWEQSHHSWSVGHRVPTSQGSQKWVGNFSFWQGVAHGTIPMLLVSFLPKKGAFQPPGRFGHCHGLLGLNRHLFWHQLSQEWVLMEPAQLINPEDSKRTKQMEESPNQKLTSFHVCIIYHVTCYFEFIFLCRLLFFS